MINNICEHQHRTDRIYEKIKEVLYHNITMSLASLRRGMMYLGLGDEEAINEANEQKRH